MKRNQPRRRNCHKAWGCSGGFVTESSACSRRTYVSVRCRRGFFHWPGVERGYKSPVAGSDNLDSGSRLFQEQCTNECTVSRRVGRLETNRCTLAQCSTFVPTPCQAQDRGYPDVGTAILSATRDVRHHHVYPESLPFSAAFPEYSAIHIGVQCTGTSYSPSAAGERTHERKHLCVQRYPAARATN